MALEERNWVFAIKKKTVKFESLPCEESVPHKLLTVKSSLVPHQLWVILPCGIRNSNPVPMACQLDIKVYLAVGVAWNSVPVFLSLSGVPECRVNFVYDIKFIKPTKPRMIAITFLQCLFKYLLNPFLVDFCPNYLQIYKQGTTRLPRKKFFFCVFKNMNTSF